MVDLLLGKITLQLILGVSSQKSIREAQELIVEMQHQNVSLEVYKPAFIQQLKTTLCHLALLNAFPGPQTPLQPERLHCLSTLFCDELFIGIVQRPCAYLQHYLLVALLHCQLKPQAFHLNHFLELHSQAVFTQESPLLPFVTLLFTQFDFQASHKELSGLTLKGDLLLEDRLGEITKEA